MLIGELILGLLLASHFLDQEYEFDFNDPNIFQCESLVKMVYPQNNMRIKSNEVSWNIVGQNDAKKLFGDVPTSVGNLGATYVEAVNGIPYLPVPGTRIPYGSRPRTFNLNRVG
jgi:hypothetical protein